MSSSASAGSPDVPGHKPSGARAPTRARAYRFTDHDSWASIAELRAAPPPNDDGAQLHAWVQTRHVPVYDSQIERELCALGRLHAGTNLRWLAIEGSSHLGKSTAVTAVLLKLAMADPLWRRRDLDGRLQTPYVYVATQTNQTSKGYLTSIAHACGLPADGDELRLRQRLSELLPRHGVKMIVLDDAHFCRRSSDNASKLTDGLRALLDLPVPIAAVGIDMDRSAWLRDPGRNNDSALQLRRRANRLTLRELRRETAPRPAQLLAHLGKQLVRIEGFQAPGLVPETVFWLTTRLQGSTGSMLEAVKNAAVEAIANNNRVMTAEHIQDAVGDFA